MVREKPNMQLEKTPMQELDPHFRAQNFEEVALGYTPEEAINEAKRCIHCPKEPCVTGCPVQVPISDFIKEVQVGNFAQAYALVKHTNALPAICGRVCPQETQCEAVCTRGRKGEPVAIGRLERFVADWAFEHPEEAQAAYEALEEKTAQDTEVLRTKRVAVIGTGPASLTCAGELAKRGVRVKAFEALHAPGGVLTYGIPEFRLPNSLVFKELEAIEKLGVEIELNAVVGKLYDLQELTEDMGFDAVFIGTGAGLPAYTGLEGEGLNGVITANELLTRVNLMKAYEQDASDTPIYAGKKCVVIGGGNVAMDAARTAKRLGCDVTIVYRRSLEEMPARQEEIHHAQEEGVNFKLLCNPCRIIGNTQGWVVGLECLDMELGQPDESGRCRPHAIEGSNFVLDCDMFVIAIGCRTNPLLAQTTPDLEVNQWNLVQTKDETGQTSIPGVFAGGDAVIGAATVILAMGAGKKAARGIIDYLLGQGHEL